MSKEDKVKILRNKLISVLLELDAIAPIQFFDTDCDNGVYNFHNVSYAEGEDRVFIELTMWNDSLPTHKDNPIRIHGISVPYSAIED